jgi:hypothetical protein
MVRFRSLRRGKWPVRRSKGDSGNASTRECVDMIPVPLSFSSETRKRDTKTHLLECSFAAIGMMSPHYATRFQRVAYRPMPVSTPDRSNERSVICRQRPREKPCAICRAGPWKMARAAAPGLPIGLQIAGAPFAESTVLALANAYECETAWHTRRHPA